MPHNSCPLYLVTVRRFLHTFGVVAFALCLIIVAKPAHAATITVPAGGDLQAALDAAKAGDTIVLEANAAYAGSFVLPRKPGTEYITIRTSASDTQLPPNTRVGPDDAPLMPKLLSSGKGLPALRTEPGAHHYRLIGIEIAPATQDALIYDLVSLGSGEQTSLDDVPNNISIDRSYIHTFSDTPLKRGVALNSASTEITNSYIAGFKVVGQDSQAIGGWNGPGPFRIINNYLEGAGENVMFGGATPTISNLVPSDIEIRRNHFAKPRSWREGDPSYAGTRWSVKNLFELKNAQRVTIDGNLFEYNWADAQNGFAILFTPRSEDGAAPWAVVRDVAFTNNIVRHSGSVFNISGRDEPSPSQQTTNIRIANNLFDDINNTWGGGGIFLQVAGTAGVVVDHNTIFHSGNIINAYGDPTTGFVFTNNIMPHNQYGIKGDGRGSGNDTINAFFPDSTFKRNVIAGGSPNQNPADNFYPASLDDVGFVDRANGNYQLAESSLYKGKATDGKDPGCDFTALAGEAPRFNVLIPVARR